MIGGCRGVRELLHRPASSLAADERLVLEGHLTACTRCRDDRARLRAVREVGEALPHESVGERGHARALAAAFLEGAAAPAPRRAAPVKLIFAAAAVIMFAAAAAVAWSTRGGGASSSDTTAFTPSADAVWQWDAGRRTAVLTAGSLEVVADPRRAGGLRVATVRFTVEVTGTRFVVDLDGVSVTEGAVRIHAPDGRVLVERLAAPGAWTVAVPTPPAPVLGAGVWLRRAREAFNGGDLDTAAHHAEAALTAGPSRAEAAAARTLLAEVAQARGDLAGAVAQYLDVAARHRDDPAAETALFAAARIEDQRGRGREAARLFRRYLELHPAGRFAADARQRLAKPE